MTAKEKFEARLQEVGLLQEWEHGGDTRVATFDEDQNIIVFVHESEEDKYSEIHYPPYSELREDAEFRKDCWDEFCDHDSAEFVSDLAMWLTKKTDKCPLFAVDVYFPGFGLRTDYHDFEDDKEEPIDLEIEEDEYMSGIDTNRGKVDLISKQLELFRKELVEMIRTEFKRGHRLPEHWTTHPGWGSISFYGYFVEYDTVYRIEEDDTISFLDAMGNLQKVYLMASDFPIDILLHIYNSMK